MLADLEDLHDVGMFEPGRGFGLAAKPRLFIRSGIRAGEDHLDATSGFSPSCRACK